MAGLTPGAFLRAPARAQYSATIAVRWRMFINGLRSIHGILDLGATGIAWTIYTVIGLGAGVGLYASSYALARHAAWRQLPIPFWAAAVLWLIMPVFAASYQDQSSLRMLLRFPVSLGSYFSLYLISGFMEASTIVGLVCCFAIWLGIVLARPHSGLPLALVLAVFAAFNILLVRAVFAWIDRWLAQRKSREILSVLFMVTFVGVQFFNPAFYQRRHHAGVSRQQQLEQERQMQARFAPALRTADQFQQWLPPGLAARAVQHAEEGQPVPAIACVGLLGIWVIAAGGTLGMRLRAESRGENLGSAPARSLAPRRERSFALGGSGPCTAAFEKEVHSLRRTVPLLWAVGIPVLLVLLIAGLFHSGWPPHSFPYALPLCVAYALLGFTQLFYNNLGAEGAGIQLLFLSPTPIRTVMLAKNLLHGLLFILVACVAIALGSVRLGLPPAALLAALAAWLLFALPCNLAAGNILSLVMPYRINPGRIGRQPGSQANALTAMLIQALVLAIGAAVLSLCWSFQKQWLAVPVLLALAAIACFVWSRVLKNIDAMARQHRDELLATLMKTA